MFRAAATTIVLSEAVLLLAAAAGSPPPLTVAMLSTDGTAVDATATVIVIAGAEVPAAIALDVVQVTVWPAAPQLHPVPVPLT